MEEEIVHILLTRGLRLAAFLDLALDHTPLHLADERAHTLPVHHRKGEVALPAYRARHRLVALTRVASAVPPTALTTAARDHRLHDVNVVAPTFRTETAAGAGVSPPSLRLRHEAVPKAVRRALIAGTARPSAAEVVRPR